MEFESSVKSFLSQIVFGLNELFPSISTDSEIFKSFQMTNTKCGYIMNFGIVLISQNCCLKKWDVVVEFYLVKV